jgi:uncharacterized protein (TIGR02271 family)
MTLRSLMQAGPARATELFSRLAETSDNAVKTRERLFAELKSELELHADLEEQHLFPLLRKHPETRELIANAVKDNKEVRARLEALENLPKNHETFLDKLTELQKAFRQHARDDKKELLPAVQRALSEEQTQTIAEKFETGLAEADQAKQDEAEERRTAARRQREQAEREAQQAEAIQQERESVERHSREMVERTAESARQTATTVLRTGEAATENMRQTVRGMAEGAQRVGTAPFTPFFFWDLMLGRSGGQQERSITPSGTGRFPVTLDADRAGAEEVIPLLEETLVVGKRIVNSGTTRVRRFVVESAVEQQVELYDEKVVVERRRPAVDAATGESFTDLTIEVVETSEVPVVTKGVHVREEIVVRKQRSKRETTVRGTVRREEIEIEQSGRQRPALVHSTSRG